MYEVKSWKEPNCDLTLKVSHLTTREPFSQEIREEHREGGALNAGYDTVEAAIKVANILGEYHFRLGVHFVFKTGGLGNVSFDFRNSVIRDRAREILGTVVV